uniref:Uncharacterized protein n=2 Tax=Homininae TaxID=207598 RepID=Q7Z4Q0_HUMAN|nr:unknown [Homo sapiens]
MQKMQPHNVFTLFYAVLQSLFLFICLFAFINQTQGNVMMSPRPMGREIKTSHP